MKRITRTIAAILCAATLPAAAHATDQSTRVTASIPEVCRFSAPSLTIADDQQTASGRAFETCNSNRGYSITAITRQLMPEESLVLSYGEDRLDLDEDGSTLLVRRTGPIFKIVDLSLETRTLSSPVSLTFAMSAV